LTAWFREYVVSLPALVVLLCGMWYGVGWTFVAWGLYHAILLVAERAGLETAVRRLPHLLRHVYLLLVIMIGWVILRSQTLGDAALFFKALAGFNPASLRPVPVIDRAVWLVLAAGANGCAPLSQAIRRWTVAIDGLILSLLMLMSAPILFTWRCGVNVATPVRRWWRQ
jgi:D-alanyl-lipoteichoic acid acyltransferase DltB (MBOAT superfamily)